MCITASIIITVFFSTTVFFSVKWFEGCMETKRLSQKNRRLKERLNQMQTELLHSRAKISFLKNTMSAGQKREQQNENK